MLQYVGASSRQVRADADGSPLNIADGAGPGGRMHNAGIHRSIHCILHVSSFGPT